LKYCYCLELVAQNVNNAVLQLRLFTANLTINPEAGCEVLVRILVFAVHKIDTALSSRKIFVLVRCVVLI